MSSRRPVLARPLRPLWRGLTYFTHQEKGIRWMLAREQQGTVVSSDGATVYGGLQCDDMGLGKTIQLTATLVHHPLPCTLLVAPLAMLETWADVCQHAGLRVYEVGREGWTRRPTPYGIPSHFLRLQPAVYLCNYEKAYHRLSLLQSVSWDRVVLDEAHKIRNGKSVMAQRFTALPAQHRWALTGTPLVNGLSDVVSLFAFLGVPCSTFTWKKTYARLMAELTIHRSLDSLRSILRAAPPPPKIQEDILPFYTEEEEDFYHGVQGGDEKRAAAYPREHLGRFARFKQLLRLRQLSVHPQVYLSALRREDPVYDRPDWSGPTTKFERIRAILQEEEKHNYIIFCQFHEEMSLIREFLLLHHMAQEENILMYHGGMNQKERNAVLAHSKASTQKTVLLLQLQAGGVGLNLQEYDRILFLSPWWTAALMDQAMARAVRMGQTRVVHVYHLRLATEDTKSLNIDAFVHEKADQKRKQLSQLFQLCNTI